MQFKKLSPSFLIVCAVFSNLESSVRGSAADASVVSQNGTFSNDVSHQGGRPCTSVYDCWHYGRCVARQDSDEKFCVCRPGTSGDFCEIVDGCSDEKCGGSNDTYCTYDRQSKMTVCKCENDSLTYLNDAKKCAAPCRYSSECPGRWNKCTYKIGEQKFCECMEGSSGENCEIVHQCRDGLVDCGVDNNATCELGKEGEAYCLCGYDHQGFDNLTKTCRDCDCGDRYLGCDFVGGKKMCRCRLYVDYLNDEGKCVSCNCGYAGYRCEYENGKKTCFCDQDYIDKEGVCVKCKCGRNEECKFEGDKPVCSCVDGYMPSGPDGTCLLICNETNPCRNGGTCSGGACSCLNGTGADLCGTIYDCLSGWKCGEADCLFDVESLEAYCKCANASLTFDDERKLCRVCDCGQHATNCTFKYGHERCTCEENYAESYAKCKYCYCKGPTNNACRLGYNGKEICSCIPGYVQDGNECKSCSCEGPIYSFCRFDYDGNQICPCEYGYKQVGNQCRRCECGGGTCDFYYDVKQCKCYDRYAFDGDQCKECDCGKNGICRIDDHGDKHCSCYKGYVEFRGKCLECNCGKHANCFFNSSGGKECVCHPEYGMKSDICKQCNCGAGNNCTFDESFNDYTKQCICREGLSDDRGSCKECNCYFKGANCTFDYGLTKCHCPEGYTEGIDTTHSPTKVFCQDVDECLQSGVCPTSAQCVNTVGSYECVCKEGNKAPPDGCGGTDDPWKTTGIVIGCLIGSIIGGVLIGWMIESRRKRAREIT